jgi:hypothetical protein
MAIRSWIDKWPQGQKRGAVAQPNTDTTKLRHLCQLVDGRTKKKFPICRSCFLFNYDVRNNRLEYPKLFLFADDALNSLNWNVPCSFGYVSAKPDLQLGHFGCQRDCRPFVRYPTTTDTR